MLLRQSWRLSPFTNQTTSTGLPCSPTFALISAETQLCIKLNWSLGLLSSLAQQQLSQAHDVFWLKFAHSFIAKALSE